MNSIPIDYEKLRKQVKTSVTDDMKAFVETQIGRSELSKMSDEAWMDFLLGVSLYGISVGIVKIQS